MSNINITATWDRPAVFAGEEVECTITIKNIAPSPRTRQSSPLFNLRADETRRHLWRSDLSKQVTSTTRTNPLPVRGSRFYTATTDRHRSAFLSRNSTEVSGAYSHRPQLGLDRKAKATPHKHGRSISIISMGPEPRPSGLNDDNVTNFSALDRRRLHTRAASVQSIPNNSHVNPMVRSVTSPRVSTYDALFDISRKTKQPSPDKGTTSDLVDRSPPNSKAGSLGLMRPVEEIGSTPETSPEKSKNGTTRFTTAPGISPMKALELGPRKVGLPDSGEGKVNNDLQTQSSKILSPVSTDQTPRSSLEGYSQSNHSTETLASEYVLPLSTYHQVGGTQTRRGISESTSAATVAVTESLMMGYVQLNGFFTLDGSLINLGPFESIKKRGIIGGQGGGGVVGIGTSKRDSGLFGSLAWSNISQSLGGLTGVHEPSSMREMKGKAETKAIPIISTPQSILFVNIKLRAGESRSFRYRYHLPEGLPPSCKGRSIKISYQLTIGIQRPHLSSQSQHLSNVDVPFKVLPSIQVNGELPVYDLKSPHIILQNTADIRPLGKDEHAPEHHHDTRSLDPTHDSHESFSSFVSHLLAVPVNGLASNPLSPIEYSSFGDGRDIYHSNRMSMKSLIELYILRGDPSVSKKINTNRFDIHRLGQRVATVMLGRPAYKLGDTIVVSIDFRHGHLLCCALYVHLETSEEIEETLALRSSASILRATRRIHSSRFETTLCARRILTRFLIPLGATADFRTSGVSLKWALRFEFTVKSDANIEDRRELLDDISIDERGSIMAAAHELQTESFEVSLPVRVFGTMDDGSANIGLSSFVV